MNINLELYVELLQAEVLRLRSRPTQFQRDMGLQGATVNPIHVNADNLHSPESKMASETIMRRTNSALDFLADKRV